MLVRLFAVLSAAATVLNCMLSGAKQTGLHLAGFALLRFAEYYVGMVLTYALAMYVSSEIMIKRDDKYDKPDKFWHWNLGQLADIICLFVGADYKVEGAEKLPEDERYMMVYNHRSFFDPIVTYSAFKKRMQVYISKPENFRIPLAGKIMHASGCMPLNREDNREALTTIKRASALIKSGEGSVVIYPEGTRSKARELLPFHAGSFKIAQKADAPVVVAALIGTDRVKHNIPFRRTKVKIEIIDVIDREFVKTHSTKETAQLAQDMIQRRLDAQQ